MVKKYRHKYNDEVVRSVESFNGFFTLSGELIPTRFIENSSDWEEIEKNYLFTTYDGVEIYEGMHSWPINKDLSISANDPIRGFYRGNSKYMLYFSTKEAAQKYIDANTKKPIFRTEDGVDLYKGDKYCWVRKNPIDISPDMYDVSKCKNNSKDYLYFSTRQAARDYVNLHTPKFSKAEIQALITDKLYSYSIMEDLINSFDYKDK